MNGAQQMPDLSTWLTDAEVCARLGISSRTLDREATAGRIVPMRRRIPGRTRPERVWSPEDIALREPKLPPQVMPPGKIPVRYRRYISEPDDRNADSVAGVAESLAELAWPAELVGALAGTLARLAGVVESCMEAPASPALWLTIPEASQYTGLSETFLRRLTRDGRLRSVRDGSIKVRREDLELVHLEIWP